eukprot:TRINITY_DN15407_c0_g1_i4.p3 TRINITY_DN15407_c0_g1~~TRINITY_DN15407_c0_g1_i4.p3  ORF type:complete len:108 (-),score=42.62 TRINITY_DN15407_c0_g1_i4:72-395(-)
MVFFFFSSRRRHTRCREVSWARRCVQETGIMVAGALVGKHIMKFRAFYKMSRSNKLMNNIRSFPGSFEESMSIPEAMAIIGTKDFHTKEEMMSRYKRLMIYLSLIHI